MSTKGKVITVVCFKTTKGVGNAHNRTADGPRESAQFGKFYFYSGFLVRGGSVARLFARWCRWPRRRALRVLGSIAGVWRLGEGREDPRRPPPFLSEPHLSHWTPREAVFRFISGTASGKAPQQKDTSKVGQW